MNIYGPYHLHICRLNRQNLTAVVEKLSAEVRYLSSKNCLSFWFNATDIFFTVQKMFCYHLRQKARQCSVQKFFEKLLKLSVCTDYIDPWPSNKKTIKWLLEPLEQNVLAAKSTFSSHVFSWECTKKTPFLWHVWDPFIFEVFGGDYRIAKVDCSGKRLMVC
jgi:hypothetical protein